MEETIEGYIEHIIYRNQENGYTVANLVAEETEITCVGIFQYLNEGEAIRAKGVYKEHPSYGQQFSVSSYEIVIPQDSLAMERYLGSGAIKGIGAALAARIVRHFGDDTLRIIETEPERLAEVKGISERKAREIAEQVEDKADMRKAMMFLQQYGISQTLGAKIYQQYKQDMYRILKEIHIRWQRTFPVSDLKLQMKSQHVLVFIRTQITVFEAVFYTYCFWQPQRDTYIFQKGFCWQEQKSFWVFRLIIWKNIL